MLRHRQQLRRPTQPSGHTRQQHTTRTNIILYETGGTKNKSTGYENIGKSTPSRGGTLYRSCKNKGGHTPSLPSRRSREEGHKRPEATRSAPRFFENPRGSPRSPTSQKQYDNNAKAQGSTARQTPQGRGRENRRGAASHRLNRTKRKRGYGLHEINTHTHTHDHKQKRLTFRR